MPFSPMFRALHFPPRVDTLVFIFIVYFYFIAYFILLYIFIVYLVPYKKVGGI